MQKSIVSWLGRYCGLGETGHWSLALPWALCILQAAPILPSLAAGALSPLRLALISGWPFTRGWACAFFVCLHVPVQLCWVLWKRSETAGSDLFQPWTRGSALSNPHWRHVLCLCKRRWAAPGMGLCTLPLCFHVKRSFSVDPRSFYTYLEKAQAKARLWAGFCLGSGARLGNRCSIQPKINPELEICTNGSDPTSKTSKKREFFCSSSSGVTELPFYRLLSTDFVFVKPSKRPSPFPALYLSLAECTEASRVCPKLTLLYELDLSKSSWYFTLSSNSWLNEFTCGLKFLLAGCLRDRWGGAARAVSPCIGIDELGT